MHKILFINPFGIGDCLFTTPLIRSIKKNLPESFIGYLCNKRVAPILSTNPYIDKIYIYEKDDLKRDWESSKRKGAKSLLGLLLSIKKCRFNLALDLSLGRHYSFFLWLIGIKERIGYNYKNRGRFLTAKINIEGYNNRHIVDYYLALLRFLKVEPDLNGLDLFVTKDDIEWADKFLNKNSISQEDFLIGIIPGGGESWGKDAKYKLWHPEKFAYVADKLIENRNAKIIVLGGREDIEYAIEVEKSMKYKPIMACGKTTLREFVALLKRCKLAITNDGGPLHIATSQNIKTISIFGPVDEKVYGPYPPNRENNIVVTKDVICRPCYKNFKLPKCKDNKCINKIMPQEILQVVENIL